MQDLEEPTFESIAQMHYLDACVNEALRMYPPVSRTERERNEDWEYKGLKIAKGTVISIPIYAIQRDEEFWPNPDVYDPERPIPSIGIFGIVAMSIVFLCDNSTSGTVLQQDSAASVHVGCSDRDPECPTLAATGKCQTDANYTREACELSCRNCHSPQAGA
ncbi:putative Cytochrome P450 3A15 [Hypsibius exemplaris]|uniref:Cytochrome P450 3A15 n=1 Tax=Hypsibius exemplaris TaxID=2072580 RepID=A0A1W0WFM7_HYPEX|nr:putative Cytochrome P450 3A15 [Hypsibius exemplaris]